MSHQILSWITFVPLIGMLVILLLPKTATSAIKGVSLAATAIPLVLATQLYFQFEKYTPEQFAAMQSSTGDILASQFVQKIEWISSIKAFYYVGVDGLSPNTARLLATAFPAATLLDGEAALRQARRAHTAAAIALLRPSAALA